METSFPPHPAIDLSAPLYYQLVYTLTDLLPPPLDDSPEALHDRNHAAIAKVAALLPVNANEADLAARAQAEDVLRLLRQHAGDIQLVLRLNAQYGSMVRTSLSVHGCRRCARSGRRSTARPTRTRGLSMSPNGLCWRWWTGCRTAAAGMAHQNGTGRGARGFHGPED